MIFLKDLRENCGYDLSFSVQTQNKEQKNIQSKNLLMSNEVVLFTGFRSQPISDFIVNNGGKIVENFNKEVTLLIYDDSKRSNTNKLTKANKMNIKTINRYDFEKKNNIK